MSASYSTVCDVADIVGEITCQKNEFTFRIYLYCSKPEARQILTVSTGLSKGVIFRCHIRILIPQLKSLKKLH